MKIPVASVLRWVCVLCFLGAACRHTSDIFFGGWLPYTWTALPINLFWTSLTVLDPLAALLLWCRPRLGAALALLLMFSDVGINTFVAVQMEHQTSLGVLTLIAQTLFLGLLIGGFPLLRSLEPSPAVRKP